jgi:hypothetical protein
MAPLDQSQTYRLQQAKIFNAESMMTFLQMTTTVLADAKIKSTKVKKRTMILRMPSL